MKVLITGAASDLGRSAAAELRRRRHRLRLTDRRRLRTDLDFVQSQLGHGPQTDRLLQGMKAVVHIPGPGREGADQEEGGNGQAEPGPRVQTCAHLSCSSRCFSSRNFR